MTVRFDLTDARERALAEYMQTLDVKKYQSRNQFVLDAIADYVDLQSITREQHEDDTTILKKTGRFSRMFTSRSSVVMTLNWCRRLS
ncbi:MAG: hypothetical protein UIH27_12005 [Ruminococcus sp.]|nr:hypothetical protein [Ruminococcus sp.]